MSRAVLNQLNEKRQAIWERCKTILDTAEAEGRELTAEESTNYDAASADMTALAARAASIVENERVNTEAEALLRKTIGNAPAPETSEEARLRAFLRGETRVFDAPAVRGSYGSLESRDLLKTGSAAALVPTTLYGSLIEFAVESSGVLQAGPTIIQTSGGELIEVPAVVSYGAAALVPEGAPIGESDPTFTKRNLGAYKYGQLVQVSSELIADEVFDIVGFITRVAGRNIGLALGVDLAVGDGVNKPSGVMTGLTTGATGAPAVAGAFTADDLINLQMSVLSPYRNSPSAGWLVRDASLGGVRKLKDGAQRYIFDPAGQVGAPDTLLGKRIYSDPNVPAVAALADSVVFGDFSAYFVRLAGGARFERSDEFAFNTDMVTFRALIRGDGLLADTSGALKVFTGGAA